MNHEIHVREAVTETETAAFWTQLYAYFLRDILPDSTEADRAYFSAQNTASRFKRSTTGRRTRCAISFLP